MLEQRTVIVTGRDTGRYGRLLGTVWLGTTDVNAGQIRNGLAWVYRYHGKLLRPDYVTLEAEACRHGTGIWSKPGQIEPWRWRSQYQERFDPDFARCRPQGKPDARRMHQQTQSRVLQSFLPLRN